MNLLGAKDVSRLAQTWDEWLRCSGSSQEQREKYLAFVEVLSEMLSGLLPTWPDKATILRHAAAAWDAAERENGDG